MSSDEPNASWHPAFMPNRASDPVTIIEPTAKQTKLLKSIDTEQTTNANTILGAEAAGVQSSERPLTAEGEDAQVDLETLRSALTTSLASPGGVELEENPVHSDTAFQGEDAEGKAQFPTTGPIALASNHIDPAYTTIAHESNNWGKDEAGSKWNLPSSHADPFESLPPSDRTNSFPPVPPAHNPDTAISQPSISGDELHELENNLEKIDEYAKDPFIDEDEEGASFFAQQSTQTTHDAVLADEGAPEYHNSVPEEVENREVPFESTRDGDALYGTRFEEGVPLVSQQEDEKSEMTLQKSASNVFGDEAVDEQASFFEEIGDSAEAQAPLNRKSTIQVIENMHFNPEEELEDDEFDIEGFQSSMENISGERIAVSKNTVLEEVIQDVQSQANQAPEETTSGNATDEDLAAKWKAALDDDEFEDDDDFINEGPKEGNQAVDPSAFFGSDDEGFLDDAGRAMSSTEGQTISPPVPAPVASADGEVVGFSTLTGSAHVNHVHASSRYTPQGASQPASQAPANPYEPPSPFVTNSHASKPATSAIRPSSQPYSTVPPSATAYGFQPQPPRPELPKAQSFADKAKGGYSSPYDLPMEVVKPRKRASLQQMSRGYNASAPPNAPPPRSSSMYGQGSHPSRGSASSLSPPLTSHSSHPPTNVSAQILASEAVQQNHPMLRSNSSFFEELPVLARPKSASRNHQAPESPPLSNQYPPGGGTPALGTAALGTAALGTAALGTTPLEPQCLESHGLVAPPKLSPYAPTHNAPAGTPPPPTSKYSPAPSNFSSQTGVQPPPLQSRYTAPSTLQRQPIPPPGSMAQPPLTHPHQPRTSSPLAHFERAQENEIASGVPRHNQMGVDRRGSSSHDHLSRVPSLPPTQEVEEPTFAPPKRSTSSYVPEAPLSIHNESGFVPPRRSQTQSPGAMAGGPYVPTTSAVSDQRLTMQSPVSPGVIGMTEPATRSRGFSQGYNFIAPTDGRERDPLQRWRGCPVFAWGVGGTVISSFPQEVPRYGMGQTAPMIIRSPGEVKVHNIKDILALEERILSFPGPVKGKSKKREVVSWLSTSIDKMDQETSYLKSLPSLSHDDKRKEERVLLWKILRVFIENDGVLEGNTAVDSAVRAVLTPGLDADTNAGTPQYTTGADLSGIYRITGSVPLAEPIDAGVVDEIRKHLLKGDREKAVWAAVDKRLWAHALLISNTLSSDLFKRVAQEFVQKEVKSIGQNTESLAALYEIFAGNFEESIDELVPPSARAGFQMISTSTVTSPSKSAVDGLDRWRETLGLILSNRSPGDKQAIHALGKLLSGYGRAEAAHICFMFGRANSVIGGIDDPQSNIVLLGADHLRQPYELDKDLEPMILSEVYELGLGLSATGSSTSIPHLSVYKLHHAAVLAEFGQREKALHYCESIAASITSQTRRSPYHHAILINALDDLNKRLKLSPKGESSSWISKPSIDKVSGTVWAKFNKFVAGDETEGSESQAGDGGSDIGPFARIAGSTPTISRSPSIADLYGSYGAGPHMNGVSPSVPTGRTASRYTPNARAYTPPQALDPSMSSYGSQRSTSFGYIPVTGDSLHTTQCTTNHSSPASQAPPISSPYGQAHAADSQPVNHHTPSHTFGSVEQAYISPSYTPPQAEAPAYGQYLQPVNVDTTHLRQHEASSPNSFASGEIPSEPQPSTDPPGPFSGYKPALGGYEPLSNGYEPPSSGYEPPSSGYEPLAYEPASMNYEPDSPIDTKPKKKSFMDDDGDDEFDSKPKPMEKTKAEKDREADEAFRKAAEADAQKAAAEKAAAAAKKSWGFGGWFGGKKEAIPDANQPGKPIRANLGEASSFYYDPDLKRWVNKKGGKDVDTTPSATPPPPRAGPPRSASGPPSSAPTSAPRPNAPPSNSSTPPRHDTPESAGSSPPGKAGGVTPENSTLGAPPSMSRTISNGSVAPLSSGPPSRPTTSMSNASSLDDLLGPAMARKGGTAKKAKRGRGYVDVMGDKSAS